MLSNAIKFTGRGGIVRVDLARDEESFSLSVRDSGQGIAPEFLSHVFERFRQADATAARRHGGLGLGLAIVRQLAELHGGAMRVASAGLGHGSTFTLALPSLDDSGSRDSAWFRDSDRAPCSVEPASDAVADLALNGIRVLLVISGEFGRTPKINGSGGRDHWAPLSTLALAGGGLKMGQVIGESAEKADVPKTTAITPQDLMATVFKVLDLDQRIQRGLHDTAAAA